MLLNNNRNYKYFDNNNNYKYFDNNNNDNNNN